jgi:cytochrome P450
MLPAFHGERMQRYGDLIAAIASEEISRWPQDTAMPVAPRMQALTLEVIMRVVFGVTDAERLRELRARLQAMLRLGTDPRTWMAFALLGPGRITRVKMFRRVLDAVDELIYDELRHRRTEAEGEQRDDILSLLLEARHEDGSAMTDVELRDELMTLLVAGHETTATAMSWTVERLLRHHDKLARLRADVEAGEDDYLDAVIKETLRLRPVLPIVVRRLTRHARVAGHDLPAGVKVAPCIHLIHRRPDIYPDPAAFRPERFLAQPPGTYTWIPFGGGVRRCLGASFALFEMQTVLSVLVRELELRAPQPTSEPVRRRAITLAPGRGAEVLVRRAPAEAATVPSQNGATWAPALQTPTKEVAA